MSDAPVVAPEVIPAKRKPGRPVGYKVNRLEVLRKKLEIEKAIGARRLPAKPVEKPWGIGKQIALVPGGIAEFMKWAKGAALRDPRFKPVIDSFYQLPESRRNAIELEEICITLGVPPGDLLGACVTVAFERGQVEAKLIASLGMPAVMRTNIKQAKLARGVEDRRMFMQATGILPVPKGSIINVANQANLQVTNDGESSGLPNFEDSVVSFSEVIRNAIDVPEAALPEPSDLKMAEDD